MTDDDPTTDRRPRDLPTLTDWQNALADEILDLGPVEIILAYQPQQGGPIRPIPRHYTTTRNPDGSITLNPTNHTETGTRPR